MELIDLALDMTKATYGGLPLVALTLLGQATIAGWVVMERFRTWYEDRRGLSASLRHAWAIRREDVWRMQVRPWVMTLMLLGPGLGLAFSTLLGAMGMGALGEVLSGSATQEALQASLASSYQEIAHAYYLMVGGTAPMILGPIILMAARGLELRAELVRGGSSDEMLLASVNRIVDSVEHTQRGAWEDMARVVDVLERISSQLGRRLDNGSGR